ncbi:hypothetical protein EXIGLDRAFT_748895 [Exidia glandulosa HHB12029]|uniref:Uncharacterized protein n=1 Tax=Exidia glandulosa HHB12029 TaxID=1314781 RepID=A0A165IVH2_EXIGL|nr:hypothetical protein EXIGLDRAFT_748895 [Exidia glandulosa HHB12029]
MASGALESATLAFKIAREATDAVPIVRQIVGSAALITEFAERVHTRREAMYQLCEKAAIYATQIDTTLSGRKVDSHLYLRLLRLRTVFAQIERLMTDEARIKSKIRRTLRDAFIAPKRAEALARELEQEIQLFSLLTAVDTSIAVSDDTRYDGEFRRLRHCDVRKIGVLAQHDCPEGLITWAAARIDGEVMAVRYLEIADQTSLALPTSKRKSAAPWDGYPDLLRGLSSVHASHPYVAQLYGRHTSADGLSFAAFRSGTGSMLTYLKDKYRTTPDSRSRTLTALSTSFKILEASWYLLRHHNLLWTPAIVTSCDTPCKMMIGVDECGEPQIGLFDDLSELREAKWDVEAAAKNLSCHLNIMLMASLSEEVYETATDSVEQFHEGRVHRIITALIDDFPILQQLWEVLRDQQLRVYIGVCSVPPLTGTTIPLPKSTILHAQEYFEEIWSGPIRSGTCGPSHLWLRHILLQQSGLESNGSLAYVTDVDVGANGLRIFRSSARDELLELENLSICIPQGSHLDAEVRRLLGLHPAFEGSIKIDRISRCGV